MIFAGDNFFKPASYTIEALCAKSYEDITHKLQDVEAQILRKRTELRQFETEYRKVFGIPCFQLHVFYVSNIENCVHVPHLTIPSIANFRHWRDSKKSPINIVRKSNL